MLFDFDVLHNVPVLKTNNKNLIKNKIYKSVKTNFKIKTIFQIHMHYLLPEIVALFFFLDSFYIYFCNNFKYSNKEMPTLFSHLIFPNELWKISDVSLFCIFLGSLITYLNLMFGKQVDSKYLMYLFPDQNFKNKYTIIQNGHKLCRFETEQIVLFRRTVKYLLPCTMATLVLLIDAFCFYNMCTHWTNSFNFYLILIWFHPLVFYGVNSKFYF